MSSKAYLRRASINEAQLMSEMRSFSKNKAMERNMTQKNEKMDRHLASRKKNQDYERYELNKSLEKTMKSKTMSADEYLERRQSKYTSLRDRERERLDRRYSNKQRAFYKDFQQLELEKYGIAVPDIYRDVREAQSEEAEEKARKQLLKAEQSKQKNKPQTMRRPKKTPIVKATTATMTRLLILSRIFQQEMYSCVKTDELLLPAFQRQTDQF